MTRIRAVKRGLKPTPLRLPFPGSPYLVPHGSGRMQCQKYQLEYIGSSEQDL